MSGNLPRSLLDVRKPYSHQAYDLTYGGISKEVGKRIDETALAVPATYNTQFWVAVDTNSDTETYFALPPGLYTPVGAVFGSTVVKAGSGTPTATVVMVDKDGVPLLLHNTTPLALGTATGAAVAFENPLLFDPDHLSHPYALAITVSGSTTDNDPTNFAMIGFDFRIVPTAWK